MIQVQLRGKKEGTQRLLRISRSGATNLHKLHCKTIAREGEQAGPPKSRPNNEKAPKALTRARSHESHAGMASAGSAALGGLIDGGTILASGVDDDSLRRCRGKVITGTPIERLLGAELVDL